MTRSLAVFLMVLWPRASADAQMREQLASALTLQGVTPAQAQRLQAAHDHIAAVLRANAIAQAPPAPIPCSGMSSWFSDQPYEGYFTVGVGMYDVHEARMCRNNVGGSNVVVWVNRVGTLADRASSLVGALSDEAGVELYRTRMPVGTIAGFPVYDMSLGGKFYPAPRFVLLTRLKEPPTLPVSRAQYVRAVLAQIEKRKRQTGGTMGAFEKLVTLQRAQLAELTDPNGPACIGDPENRSLSNLIECDADKEHIVYLNPKLIDAKLPQDAVQVLIVRTPGAKHPMESKLRYEARQRILETIDYEELARLLHPK